jgi:hypothetical protein
MFSVLRRLTALNLFPMSVSGFSKSSEFALMVELVDTRDFEEKIFTSLK